MLLLRESRTADAWMERTPSITLPAKRCKVRRNQRGCCGFASSVERIYVSRTQKRTGFRDHGKANPMLDGPCLQ